MNFDVTSVVSLIIFCVMAVIVVGWLFSLVWRWLSPMIANSKGFWHALRSLRWRVNYVRRRRLRRRINHFTDDDESSSDDDDDDDDELDSMTVRMLSLMEAATIVVDKDDEVERASSSTYRWGIVHNDDIVNEEILSAIREVREGSGTKKFNIVTHTAQDLVRDDGADAPEGVTDSAVVTRPHWLTVTVSSLSEHYIVVFISDNSEAKRFAQTRDDFIENVAQQLLNSTEDMLAIGKRWEQVDNDSVNEDGKIVSAQARHLHKLVSDLMLLMQAQEKVEASDENLGNLGDMVGEALEEIKPNRGIRLHTRMADNVMVHASAVQIRAAVRKLVENAVHYSKDNAVVSVVVDVAQDPSFAVIRVIDTGTGISKAEQSRIFERFYRGSHEPYDNTDDAVGLGLAIVKHVALTHHGTVTLWSAPGQGSTFNLFIPLAA
ncbi:sensor histidine kinase [Alloscardovia omnicolens]|uniref:sensor histidine kinase n=1 Tax=Alloscardovia omnicolens TaxID=419015 RepID=UPI003A76B62C